MKRMNWRQDQEYLALVSDLLARPEVQRLQTITHHHYSNRLEHSINVSYQSYLWGKKYSLDTRALARGGLLHDLFYYDWDPHQMDFRTHAHLHAQIALNNAEHLTDLSAKERDIIVKHMFGATSEIPCYPESWIVSLVDDYCAVEEALAPKLINWKQKMLLK